MSASKKRMLIYYGWLNSFNSETNQWDNEKVSIELATYGVLVLGAGLEDPTHGDYANTVAIIARVKELNPEIKIFGYVTANQPEVDFQAKVELWENLAVSGIFMDEAGYDYGVNRDDFNSKVAFVHSQAGANICFVNAWNPHHVLSREDDPSFPNSTHNSNDNNSLLNSDDWYLLESLFVNTDAYASNNGFSTVAETFERKTKLEAAKAVSEKNVKVAACSIINDSNPQGQCLFNIFYSMSCMVGADFMGSSDSLYGASSAKSMKWKKPAV